MNPHRPGLFSGPLCWERVRTMKRLPVGFCLGAWIGGIVLLAPSVVQAVVLLPYEQVVLGDNPVAYWRLEETTGTTAYDSSGNAKDGTYTGGVTLGQAGGPMGGMAARFDGSSGHVQLPGTWGGTDWSALTIEAWVNTDSPVTGDFQSIVASSNESSLNFAHFHLGTSYGTGARVMTGGGAAWAEVQPPPSPTPTGVWRHIALVAQSGDTRVYVDGLRTGTGSTLQFTYIVPSYAGDVAIGRGGYGGGGNPGRWFKGLIDEVAIYKTALSDQQVLAHYIAGQPEYVRLVAASQPVIYYKLHEAGVSTGARAGNYGFLGASMHGTYRGSFTDVPSAYSPLVFAKQFNSSYVSVPAVSVPGADNVQQFTFEFWMKPSTSNDLQAIYAADGWSQGKVHLNLSSSGQELELGIYGLPSPYPRVNLAPYAPLGQWSHIVVTYDTLSTPGNYIVNYYVNGALIETDTGTGSQAVTFATTGSIGAWYITWDQVYSRYFKGALGDFAVYPYVLSAHDVYLHYAGIPEPSTWVLMVLGALGLAGSRLFARRKKS